LHNNHLSYHRNAGLSLRLISLASANPDYTIRPGAASVPRGDNKGRTQHVITRLLGFISLNQTLADTQYGRNALSSRQFDDAAQVISCDSLARVLLTFINELPLRPPDPEHALMIGEREMCCTTA
jgi:hypothetical protein